jgi:hypothetical protein
MDNTGYNKGRKWLFCIGDKAPNGMINPDATAEDWLQLVEAVKIIHKDIYRKKKGQDIQCPLPQPKQNP